MTKCWLVGPIAIAWYTAPAWFIRKWRYDNVSSWRHGTAQVWRVQLYW